MGQLALGFRSLAIRAAVFFALAAALAWILGGTLFPRPETADMKAVTFNGEKWFWRVSVGGDHAGEAHWSFMRGNDKPQSADSLAWREAAGPVVHGDTLAYGGLFLLDPADPRWCLVIRRGAEQVLAVPMPDRLAVEEQLARIGRGLPVQPVSELAPGDADAEP